MLPKSYLRSIQIHFLNKYLFWYKTTPLPHPHNIQHAVTLTKFSHISCQQHFLDFIFLSSRIYCKYFLFLFSHTHDNFILEEPDIALGGKCAPVRDILLNFKFTHQNRLYSKFILYTKYLSRIICCDIILKFKSFAVGLKCCRIA